MAALSPGSDPGRSRGLRSASVAKFSDYVKGPSIDGRKSQAQGAEPIPLQVGVQRFEVELWPMLARSTGAVVWRTEGWPRRCVRASEFHFTSTVWGANPTARSFSLLGANERSRPNRELRAKISVD